MRDVLTILFPYLVLLYVFDCVVRVRTGHRLFVSHLGRRFRVVGDGAHAVGLLPTSQAVLSHDLPLFLSAGGVHLPAVASRWDRPLDPRDLRYLPWREIVSAASAGQDVLINRTVSVALPTAAAAAATASAIREIAASPPARRRENVEARIAESYDLRALAGLRETLRIPLLGVSIMSSLLFLCVYAILPLALFSSSFRERSLTPLLLAMAVAYLVAGAAAVAARRAIDPGDAPGRARLALLLILLPPGAAHVLAQLTRDLFARYDHLTIAAVLARPGDLRRIARAEMARCVLSEVPPGDAALADALRMRERAVRHLLDQAGLDADEILASPRKRSAEAERYCPACAVEYLEGADRCADCGIPLARFGDTNGIAGKNPLARGDVAGKMKFPAGA